jgi:hypothetical protein
MLKFSLMTKKWFNQLGIMGQFSSVMITPPEMNFDSIIVNANDGEVEVIKSR